MNKEQFEKFLREKLSVLKDSEVNEIVDEYLQHIEMKKNEGISEEEAIKDFGNLNTLVDEILDAYKIDTSKDQFENMSNSFRSGLNQVLNYINTLVKSLMKKSNKDIIALIVEFILILLLIGLVTYGFDVVSNIISRAFYFLPYFIYRFINFVIRFLSTILQVMVSISILYWFANERIVNRSEESAENIKIKEVIEKNKKKQKQEASDNLNEGVSLDSVEKENSQEQKKNDLKVKLSQQKSNKNFSESLLSKNLLIIRVILFIVLIPMIVIAVFLGIIDVIVIYNTIIGYGSWGISLILAGISLVYFSIIISAIKFVGGGRKKWKKL